MSPHLERELMEKFPTIYPALPINGGFQTGDGWYDLIAELSGRLEALVLGQPECARFSCDEVKEKWGGLRMTFAVDDYGLLPEDISAQMEAITREALARSRLIDETTGATLRRP